MQFVNAMSPSLLLLSNPVALRRAMETGGGSLVSGMSNLLADLRDGRLSIVDSTAFPPGRNLAITPGKVVYRNRLIELIQYAPSTPSVHAIPREVLLGRGNTHVADQHGFARMIAKTERSMVYRPKIDA